MSRSMSLARLASSRLFKSALNSDSNEVILHSPGRESDRKRQMIWRSRSASSSLSTRTSSSLSPSCSSCGRTRPRTAPSALRALASLACSRHASRARGARVRILLQARPRRAPARRSEPCKSAPAVTFRRSRGPPDATGWPCLTDMLVASSLHRSGLASVADVATRGALAGNRRGIAMRGGLRAVLAALRALPPPA